MVQLFDKNKESMLFIAKIIGGMVFSLYIFAYFFYTFLLTPSSLLVTFSLIPFECAEGYTFNCPRIVVVNFLYYNLILVLFSCWVAFKMPKRGGILILLHLIVFILLQIYLLTSTSLPGGLRAYPFFYIPWVHLFAIADIPLLIAGTLYLLAEKKKKIKNNLKTRLVITGQYILYYLYGIFIVKFSSMILDCNWGFHNFDSENYCTTFTLLDVVWYIPLILIILDRCISRKLKSNYLNKKII